MTNTAAPHRALGLGDGKRRRMGCARVGLRRTGRRARGSWRPTARPRGFPCEIAPGRPARSREISRSRMLTPLVLAVRARVRRPSSRARVRACELCVCPFLLAFVGSTFPVGVWSHWPLLMTRRRLVAPLTWRACHSRDEGGVLHTRT